MKRINLLVATVALGISLSACAKAEKITLTKMQGAITGKHTKVFSQDNLFKKRNMETGEWYALMDAVKVFVNERSKGNKKLDQAFYVCNAVSMQLVNTLKVSYNAVFSQPTLPAQKNIDLVKNSVKALQDKKGELARASGDLKKTTYYLTGKKEAKTVLLQLILTLDVTIDKLAKDFDKTLAQRAGEPSSKDLDAVAKALKEIG